MGESASTRMEERKTDFLNTVTSISYTSGGVDTTLGSPSDINQALVDGDIAFVTNYDVSGTLVTGADKGDPYPKRCKCTAAQVAYELGLQDDEWIISFQSRFGKQEWVKPYTDVVLEDWGKSGVRSVQVISPAFSADCLETLEELAIENRDNFLNAGGQEYHYIPALNLDEAHIDLLEALSLPLVKGWAGTLDGWA